MTFIRSLCCITSSVHVSRYAHHHSRTIVSPASPDLAVGRHKVALTWSIRLGSLAQNRSHISWPQVVARPDDSLWPGSAFSDSDGSVVRRGSSCGHPQLRPGRLLRHARQSGSSPRVPEHSQNLGSIRARQLAAVNRLSLTLGGVWRVAPYANSSPWRPIDARLVRKRALWSILALSDAITLPASA